MIEFYHWIQATRRHVDRRAADQTRSAQHPRKARNDLASAPSWARKSQRHERWSREIRRSQHTRRLKFYELGCMV
jgi:hypothetical protein